MQESQLIEAISALAPMIEEHAAEATRLRQPVDAVMQAIEATGVYKYFVPKRYGGYEFSVEGFTEIGTILGAADVSTGWVVTFCIEHNWLLGLYNKDAQEEIFSHHPYVIAPGVLAPTGTARPSKAAMCSTVAGSGARASCTPTTSSSAPSPPTPTANSTRRNSACTSCPATTSRFSTPGRCPAWSRPAATISPSVTSSSRSIGVRTSVIFERATVRGTLSSVADLSNADVAVPRTDRGVPTHRLR